MVYSVMMDMSPLSWSICFWSLCCQADGLPLGFLLVAGFGGVILLVISQAAVYCIWLMVVRSMLSVGVSSINLSKVLTTLFSFLSFSVFLSLFHWLGFDFFKQLYIFIFQLVIVMVIVIIIIWCFMITWWYWVFWFRVDFRFQNGSYCPLFFFRLLAIFLLESVTFYMLFHFISISAGVSRVLSSSAIFWSHSCCSVHLMFPLSFCASSFSIL